MTTRSVAGLGMASIDKSGQLRVRSADGRTSITLKLDREDIEQFADHMLSVTGANFRSSSITRGGSILAREVHVHRTDDSIQRRGVVHLEGR